MNPNTGQTRFLIIKRVLCRFVRFCTGMIKREMLRDRIRYKDEEASIGFCFNKELHKGIFNIL